MDNKLMEYKSFYEVVKKWTINDYFTAGIKAEVILDMLLSEYIPGIIEQTIGESGKHVKLVAKEFPIQAKPNKKNPEANTGNRSAKIDYLLWDGQTTYVVELKTDNLSFDVDQYENYISRICSKNLCKIFNNIVASGKSSKYPKYNDFKYIIDNEDLKKLKQTKKYALTFLNLLRCVNPGEYEKFLQNVNNGDTVDLEKTVGYLRKALNEESPENIKLIYLSLEPITSVDFLNAAQNENKGIEVYNIFLESSSNYSFAKKAILPENDEVWNLFFDIFKDIDNAEYDDLK